MENKIVEVAYLSYDGLTDPLGQSQIIPYLIGLSKHGLHFTIFSFEKSNRFAEKRKEIENQLSKYNIEWFPLRYTKWPPVISTIWDIVKLWMKLKAEIKKTDFEIIHCRSYITSLVGLRAKRNFGTKFVFDMRGFWADERVEGGLWNLSNPIYKAVYKFFKRRETRFLVESDQIISLTENAKQEILSWNLNCSPISVIPTCVDLELFDPAKIKSDDKEKLRRQLKIQEDDFVLLYLGSWGTWYLTKEMLDFFIEIKKEKKKAKFLIVTTDVVTLNDFPLNEQVILTAAKRELVPLYISLANLAVCFIKPTYSKKASSATKIGEILALDVPVVINEKWGDSELMKTLGAISIENFRKSDFNSKSINRDDLVVHLSLESGVKKYKSAYDELS